VFPYLLIYKTANRKKVITIISVFHTSRNPKMKYSGSLKKGKRNSSKPEEVKLKSMPGKQAVQ